MFQSLLSVYDFKQSVNGLDYCIDNAFKGSLYHSLKSELLRGVVFNCVSQLRKVLSGYINKLYNPVRLYSGIDYLSSIEYE